MNENPITPVPRDIRMVTAEINLIQERAKAVVLDSAIEIGRRLYEAKAILPHGEWGNGSLKA